MFLFAAVTRESRCCFFNALTIVSRRQIPKRNFLEQRAQNHACMSYAES